MEIKVRLPLGVLRMLEERAAEEGMSVEELIKALVEGYVLEHAREEEISAV